MSIFLKAIAVAYFLALSFGAQAHDGHDHGDASHKQAAPALPRAAAFSDAFEILAVADRGELTIYLDRFATNEPVSGAVITVETPQGSVEAKPFDNATYRVAAPWSTKAGNYELTFTVVSGGSADILSATLNVPDSVQAHTNSAGQPSTPVLSEYRGVAFLAIAALIVGIAIGIVTGRRPKVAVILVLAASSAVLMPHAFAHDGDDHGKSEVKPPPASRDIARLLSDGSVFVPKGTQRILGIRTDVSKESTHARSVELPGRVVADPNASGLVQTAIGGRLSPPDGGFPRLGTKVKKGDVLAYITPPLQAIDLSDMRQRQGELEQQIAIVERRVARYESLAPSGAIAKTQLEEAKIELQGLKDRRASLDKARLDPEQLVAPVDGIIADGVPVAGQVVQPNAVVFNIIDPNRLWVEALSYEALPSLARGSIRVNDRDLSLAFRGSGFADRNQSIPVHFAIEGDSSGLRVGQFVTVVAETPDRQQGIAVPRTSLVRGTGGQDIVYEHVDAESFEPRMVRTEPLDGQRVLISQGLPPGKRVVVQGAELIEQIR